MKNTFDNELNRLVNYVREHSMDGSWVVIKYRDVPKIAEVSSYYVRKIFEMLKDHPNIVFEVNKEADTYKKPLMFKYVSEEEKNSVKVSERNFQYLDQEEISFALKKLNMREEEEESYHVLNAINFIASMGAKDNYIALNVGKISDILVENKKKIQDIVTRLTKVGIIVDRGNKSKLLLSSEALSQLNNPFLENSETSSGLLENMQGFVKAIESMHSDFQGYLHSQISAVMNDTKREEELEKGHRVLQDVIAEKERLQHENESLKKSLNSAKNFRSDFIEKAESRLEVLLAEIIGIVSSYANTPAWQKDEKMNAKLQKSILSAVTAAVEGLLED